MARWGENISSRPINVPPQTGGGRTLTGRLFRNGGGGLGITAARTRRPLRGVLPSGTLSVNELMPRISTTNSFLTYAAVMQHVYLRACTTPFLRAKTVSR